MPDYYQLKLKYYGINQIEVDENFLPETIHVDNIYMYIKLDPLKYSKNIE